MTCLAITVEFLNLVFQARSINTGFRGQFLNSAGTFQIAAIDPFLGSISRRLDTPCVALAVTAIENDICRYIILIKSLTIFHIGATFVQDPSPLTIDDYAMWF